jgi:hypothetical protein
MPMSMLHVHANAACSSPCSMDMNIQHRLGHTARTWVCRIGMGMQYGHHEQRGQVQYMVLHGVCPCSCPCCMFQDMLRVHVDAACPCPCCIPMFMLNAHVHSACSCPCCMSTPMLHV